MTFNKKTIKDYDLENKTVLLRVDYNVPLSSGVITGDYRIRQSLQTIEYILSKNTKLIICSHLGKPKGRRDLSLSLKPVAKRLSELLGRKIEFSTETVGDSVTTRVKTLRVGEVLLLENLRFHEGEEVNDPEFAKRLASLADVFVQDGFGIVHEVQASTVAITKFLPSVAGLLLFNEVNTISDAMTSPNRPLVSIVGGAKISEKIDIVKRLIDISDVVIIGGAMANTFHLANGMDIGSSLADRSDIELSKDILDLAKKKAKRAKFSFYLPQDGVVADDMIKPTYTRIVDFGSHAISDIEAYPKLPKRTSFEVKKNEKILDIGPFSGAFIAGSIQLASSVIWNGTLGVTETKSVVGPVGPFSHGSELVIEALLGQFGSKPFSIIGGGDTVAYIEGLKLESAFSHVSTGGGASMSLMSGKKLPGVEALLNANG
ncbi:MAG TPA: phosphoglycerate kinase [Candidatus Saccharimonadia bacterium]|nr:phosphoglycerate kinase [Candidatus Saccharimonadia bacterium]